MKFYLVNYIANRKAPWNNQITKEQIKYGDGKFTHLINLEKTRSHKIRKLALQLHSSKKVTEISLQSTAKVHSWTLY